MAKRRAGKELTDRNWDQEDEPEEAGEIELASEDALKGRQILKGKRRGASTTQTKEFSGFSGFSFKPTAASTPFSFNVRSVINGSAENKEEQKEKKNETENGQERSVPSSNGAKKKKSYLPSLKSLNESVLAWIKGHVDKDPFCILTPVFKDYEKHLSEIMKSKEAEKTEIVAVDEKSKEDTMTTQAKISPSFGFSYSQNLTKSSTDTKSSSSEVKSTESEVKVQTTEVKSSGFTFGNSFMSSTTTTSTQSMSLGSSVQFGTTFSSSSTVPSFPGFNFKPTTDLQKPSSGFNFKPTTDLQKPSSAFSFGVAKPKEGEGSASQEEDDEYVPPKPESNEVPEDGSVYSIKCKLFYQKSGTWTERGVGYLHLKPSDDKLQLVVRADTTLGYVILNIILSPSIPLQRQGKNNVSMICVPNPPVDSKADPTKPVPMLVRVKTAEDADQLLQKMNEFRKKE